MVRFMHLQVANPGRGITTDLADICFLFITQVEELPLTLQIYAFFFISQFTNAQHGSEGLGFKFVNDIFLVIME